MKLRIVSPGTLALVAAAVIAGPASADPYGYWRGGDSSIDGSFNPVTTTTTTVTKSEDNDVTKSEDNDISIRKSHSEDNDITVSKSHSEDNDYTYSNTEDNDYWSSRSSHSEVFKPELTSYKFQSQQAGHSASAYVTGSAQGHDVYASGSRNDVSIGNEQSFVAGPYFNNVNQNNPQTLLVTAPVSGGVSQESTLVAGDVKTFMVGPIGETRTLVGGDVGQASSSMIGQSGDSSNSIADPQSVALTK